jgi:riboflavin kinase / FMN adenylyltransferase
MHVCRGLPSHSATPLALTIGNFDGVHRGHQVMLSRLKAAAMEHEVPAAVLTFVPPPREFFAPEHAPSRLSTPRDKLERFAELGVDCVYLARFNKAMAGLTADEFIECVLVQSLNVKWLLVGDDFRFGKGRQGNFHTLVAAAPAKGFVVETLATVEINGERASSTAVREALARGDLEWAAQLLDRRYTLSGHVAYGDKLGRGLGFPTANIALRHKPALSGIFAVRVHGLGAAPRDAVASLGVRPTVKAGAHPLLEVHLFDFDKIIYGRRITVEFLHKLRDEEKYPDLHTLTRQIEKDVAAAKSYLAQHPVSTQI